MIFSLSLFLSSKRGEGSGCERSSLFHQWMGSDFSLSLSKKIKKSETKMTASVLKQEILPPKFAGFV